MRVQIKILLATILLWSFSGASQAANIVVSLDRKHAPIDESFRLDFQAEGSVDEDPDFSPLLKDFEILSQHQSTNMTFINGQYSRKAVWSLELLAKSTGMLTIPSVTFGKDRSPASRIKIKGSASSNNSSANNNDEVFLQVEFEPGKAWVQSQIIVKLRLFSRISLNNLRSSEAETSDPDAIIKQMDNAHSYEAFRGGLRYAVHEIRYAIFPQHSGKLEFKPMIFEGRILRGRSQSFLNQFMSPGERKRVRSKSIYINVNAKPKAIKNADWLPAKNLTVSQQWSADVTELKAGEPVTRTITITAHGLMAENLPEINNTEIQYIKQYPDKASLDNKITVTGLSSSKQIKIALIPTRAGSFKLPPITIPWWNTKTGKQEIARLPEHLLLAHGEVMNKMPITRSKAEHSLETESDDAIKLTDNDSMTHWRFWPWLSLILAIGWLLTLIGYFRKKTKVVATKIQVDQASLNALAKLVHKHGNNHQANQTKDALIKWAKLRWPQLSISSLTDISIHVDSDLAAEINHLNTTLYAANVDQWQGSALINAFKNQQQKKSSAGENQDTALEPLYKI